MSRISQFGKDMIVYEFGGILAKKVAFLPLPIYTCIFTPAESGTIEMLSVISVLLGTFGFARDGYGLCPVYVLL